MEVKLYNNWPLRTVVASLTCVRTKPSETALVSPSERVLRNISLDPHDLNALEL